MVPVYTQQVSTGPPQKTMDFHIQEFVSFELQNAQMWFTMKPKQIYDTKLCKY